MHRVLWGVTAVVVSACGDAGGPVGDSGAEDDDAAAGGESSQSDGASSGAGSSVGGSVKGDGGAETSTGGNSEEDAAGGANMQTGGNNQGGGTMAGSGGLSSDAGGAAASTGGTTDGGGGQDGVGGDVGGSGGSSSLPGECTENYDACGCGCCDAEPTEFSCYYPELDESLYPESKVSLPTIRQEDEALAMSEECNNAGCSTGTRYVCCTSGEVDGEATYSMNGWSDSQNHIIVYRHGSDERCGSFELSGPSGVGYPYPLDLPFNLSFWDGADKPCGEESDPRPAVGATGWFVSASGCIGFDMTVFFLNEDGTAEPVRFENPGLWFSEDDSGVCMPPG